MALQIRRGLAADLPANPADGEMLYAYDTQTLYVGFGGTAHEITASTGGLSLASLSVTDSGGDGSLSYDNTTGVFTYTGPSATEVRNHFTAGTGVTISSGSISIGQAVATTDNVTFGNVTATGDLVVNGDLTVSGTTTTINTETINLADNKIVLNSNATGSATEDGGIEIERGDDTNKTLLWDETNDRWTVGAETFVAGTFQGNIKATNSSLAKNELGNVTGTATIDLSLGNFITATATGATTWSISNSVSGTFVNCFVLELVNGGSATQTWMSGIKWPGGTAPTLTASGTDILAFISSDNGTTWRGVASMIDSK